MKRTTDRIGMLGLGRLGLPVAVAIAERGYDTVGYDLDALRMKKVPQGYIEGGPNGDGDFNNHLLRSSLRYASSIADLVDQVDIVFVAVQTPHPINQDGRFGFELNHLGDFDYTYLQEALRCIASVVKRPMIISIISTVLPGTWKRYLEELANPLMRVVYNPFFIAMGSTMRDFLYPEFVLLGVEDSVAANRVDDFYRHVILNDAPRCQMSITAAEATKVLYNTYISAKISVVNTAQMVCDAIHCDAGEVLGALRLGTKRLLSDQYLWPGMGDGGGCHPRDLLALGWFVEKNLARPEGGNFYAQIMRAREDFALYLAEKLARLSIKRDLPIGIYGYAFKRNVAITDGSHALLVSHLLKKRFSMDCYLYDPMIDEKPIEQQARVFLVGANHDEARIQKWPPGSVVVDPWHIIDAPEVEVIRIG